MLFFEQEFVYEHQTRAFFAARLFFHELYWKRCKIFCGWCGFSFTCRADAWLVPYFGAVLMNSSEKSLSELYEQLAQTRKEVSGITEDVAATLEKKWPQFHTVIFPPLVSYCEHAGVQRVLTFLVSAGHILPLPNLSVQPCDLPAQISLIHDLSVVSNVFGESAVEILQRSMASREMEFDFAAAQATAPFCLFDAVVGVFFFEFKELREESYSSLTAATEKFFDRVRREILVGRIAELKKSPQRAG